MKILLSLAVIGVVFGMSHGFMNMNDFKRLIEPKCYKMRDNKELLNGQESPLPSSIETFVSLVERIERNYTNWNKERIIENLLLRFRYDDLEYMPPADSTKKGTFQTRGGGDIGKVHDILKRIFQVTGPSEIKEDDFTDDEECALYYMLSHTVNDTYIEGEEYIEINPGAVRAPANPREQGVVSLNARTRHAFSLNKVLLGILAGLKGSTYIDASSIFNQFKTSPTATTPDFLVGKEINNIFSATLGDIISLTIFKKGNRNEVYYLPNGYWEEAVCNLHYKLDRLDPLNGGYATLSLIRGGIDGFILGKVLNGMEDKEKKDLKLSQILRMYYSPTGFTIGADISWCTRESQFRTYFEEVKKEAIAYDALIKAVQDKSDSDAADAEGVVSGLQNWKLGLFEEPHREAQECQLSALEKVCETPSDIFAIMYYREDQNKILQNEVIGNFSTGFQMALYDSSMSVFTNLRSSGKDLDTIVNASRTSGCPGCAIAHRYGSLPTADSEFNVFRGLYDILESFDEANSESPGVPARMVLYFNYGNPGDDHQLRDAIDKVRYGFRGTSIFALGSNKDRLRIFVENGETDTFTNTDAPSLIKILKDKICKVPAQLQFKNCYKRASDNGESNNKYQGFITPKSVQYWAMYPKHFLKSFYITFKFRPIGTGQLKVCFSRNYDEIFKPKEPSTYCPELKDDVFRFDVKNPCKGFKEYNCPPFYFYVEGKTAPTTPCIDSDQRKCETPDQIRYEVEHTGISCNGALGLAFSPMTAILTFFTLVFAFYKQ